MMECIQIPDKIQAINDRGEEMHIVINASKEIEDALTRAGQSLDSDILLKSERRVLPQESLTLHAAGGGQYKVISGALCVNPVANQWWLEGLGSGHRGAFFMSKTKRIKAIK